MGVFMRIQKEVINEITINRSRFICYLNRVNNEDEAKSYIKHIKKLHPKATHHCQAFIITNELERSNDDGEPSGTAGIPMLEVLRHQRMNYICAVVVRYFGGTLLGSGGLIRAYTKSVSEALLKAQIYETIIYQRYQINFHYSYIDKIDHLLKTYLIENKEYTIDVMYQFLTTNKDILIKLKEITNGNITINELTEVSVEELI